MQTLTARAPARWPTARGRRRRAAQRPLPSMMMATWRGRSAGFRAGEGRSGPAESRWSASVNGMAPFVACGRIPGPGTASDRHQLLFLGLDHLVDVLDRLVGDLLDLVLAATLLILGDLLFLEQFLGLLDGVAADGADRDLGILALAVHHLGQLLAALLGQDGDVGPDRGAGGVRGQAEVRGQDRLLHRARHLLLPGRDRERA